MSSELICTGMEVELFATHIFKVEPVAPGIVRIYWVAQHSGDWRVTHTQIVPDAVMAALRARSLYIGPTVCDEHNAEVQRH